MNRYHTDHRWQRIVDAIQSSARNEGALALSDKLLALQRSLDRETLPALLEQLDELLGRMERLQVDRRDHLAFWSAVYGKVSEALRQLADASRKTT